MISTVSGAIPKGSQAITVSLDQNHAVGGFVTPGDKVNVILNFPITDAPGDASAHKATAFLLPGPEGAGGRLVDGPAASAPARNTSATNAAAQRPRRPADQPSSLITLQVTPRQAEQIVQGTDARDGLAEPEPARTSTPGEFKSPTEIVDEINLFNQTLTEAQKRARSDAGPAAARRSHSVDALRSADEHRERAVMETDKPERASGRAALPRARGRTRRAARVHESPSNSPASCRTPLSGSRRSHARARSRRADGRRVRPEPRGGPTASPRCNASRARFPEVGVVLLAEELTTLAAPGRVACGCSRRAHRSTPASARSVPSVERVGETMSGVVNRAAAASSEPARLGKMFVAFSTKGGVGKSVVATNLAVLLATRNPGRVALVDADLQFGDDAVLLGVPPQHTSADAAAVVDTIDAQLMDGFLATHEASSLRVLCAPVEPAAGERITAEEMIGMVRMLRTMFDYVVVDMPPHFDDVVLALLEEADEVLLIASLDIPSIKNLKVGIQTLDLLSVAGSKLHLVMNRANATCPPRHQRRRAGARRQRGVPHPVRHRDPAVGQPGCAGRARQAPRAGRARAARARGQVLNSGPGPADAEPEVPARAAASRLAPIANRRSHIMTQQYSRWQDLQRQPGSARPAQIEELRLRVHQFVIDQVGPKLSDDERRRRRAASPRAGAGAPGAGRRAHRALGRRAGPAHPGRHRRHPRLRPDRPLPARPGHHRSHGERPEGRSTSNGAASSSAPTSSSSTKTTCGARSTRS